MDLPNYQYSVRKDKHDEGLFHYGDEYKDDENEEETHDGNNNYINEENIPLTPSSSSGRNNNRKQQQQQQHTENDYYDNDDDYEDEEDNSEMTPLSDSSKRLNKSQYSNNNNVTKNYHGDSTTNNLNKFYYPSSLQKKKNAQQTPLPPPPPPPPPSSTPLPPKNNRTQKESSSATAKQVTYGSRTPQTPQAYFNLSNMAQTSFTSIGETINNRFGSATKTPTNSINDYKKNSTNKLTAETRIKSTTSSRRKETEGQQSPVRASAVAIAHAAFSVGSGATRIITQSTASSFPSTNAKNSTNRTSTTATATPGGNDDSTNNKSNTLGSSVAALAHAAYSVGDRMIFQQQQQQIVQPANKLDRSRHTTPELKAPTPPKQMKKATSYLDMELFKSHSATRMPQEEIKTKSITDIAELEIPSTSSEDTASEVTMSTTLHMLGKKTDNAATAAKIAFGNKATIRAPTFPPFMSGRRLQQPFETAVVSGSGGALVDDMTATPETEEKDYNVRNDAPMESDNWVTTTSTSMQKKSNTKISMMDPKERYFPTSRYSQDSDDLSTSSSSPSGTGLQPSNLRFPEEADSIYSRHSSRSITSARRVSFDLEEEYNKQQQQQQRYSTNRQTLLSASDFDEEEAESIISDGTPLRAWDLIDERTVSYNEVDMETTGGRRNSANNKSNCHDDERSVVSNVTTLSTHHNNLGVNTIWSLLNRTPVREFRERANNRIVQVNDVTRNELDNIMAITTTAVIHGLGLSSAVENINDLQSLQQSHQVKMKRLRNHNHDDSDDDFVDDHGGSPGNMYDDEEEAIPENEEKTEEDYADEENYFDFALILTPQEVYSFWADQLDFRAEYFGTEWFDADQQEEQQSSDECSVSVIDARPFTVHNQGSCDSTGDNDNNMTPIANQSETNYPPGTCMSKYSVSEVAGRGAFTCNSKKRQSLFERAVDVFSPSANTNVASIYRPSAKKTLLNSTPNSDRKPMATPLSSMTRRRWGNRGANTPADLSCMSPPVLALKRSSILRKRSSDNIQTPKDQSTSSRKRRKSNNKNPNCICVEDIPDQVIPRGIAARTYEIEQFLCALKKGIVLRRHRANAKAVFCKIFSSDGGDTIHYRFLEVEEAMMCLKEQRGRYNNRKSLKRRSPKFVKDVSKRWSDVHEIDSTSDDDKVGKLSLPDYIAAKHYRKDQIDKNARVPKKVVNIATKVAKSGTIRTSDIIAVHPARFEDPRSETGDFGTASLRRSKSEYYTPHTFSVVSSAAGWMTGQYSNTDASERWHSNKGTDVQFKEVNFEAATEGEYWLVFRGLLLLHRDACSGRYAKQRSAGFGSSNIVVNRERVKDEEEIIEKLGTKLNEEIYREPPTLTCIQKLVYKLNKNADESYLTGNAPDYAVPPPSDYFLGFRSPGTAIWSRLRQSGLHTQRIYGIDTRNVMIKIHCPSDRLTDVAEVLRLKLKTKDGSFAAFREDNVSIFQKMQEDEKQSSIYTGGARLFKSSDRQRIIDFIIRSRIRDSGAQLGPNTDLGKLIANRVPLHCREQLDLLSNTWVFYWRRENWTGRDGRSTVVGSIKPNRKRSNSTNSASHACSLSFGGEDFDDEETLISNEEELIPNFFFRLVNGAFHQPLDSVEQYFGEKVAFYYAWLQHISKKLILLSVLGLIVFICQAATGHWDHPLRPFFSVVIMIWSFIVLVTWRQYSNSLAYKWGTMDIKQEETTRPQFRGELRRDEITNEWVVYYPAWKRWAKYLISGTLTLVFTVGVFILILTFHANRDILLARYFELKANPGSERFQFDLSIKAIGQKAPINAVELNREHLTDPTFWIITAGYPSLLGLCLPLLNLILMRVSVILNDFENYRTESAYRTHLIIKVFSFRFVSYFAALYYYVYVSIGTDQAIENGILRVGTGVFVYVTVAHWWQVFLSVYFPMLLFRINLFRRRLKLVDELREVELEEFKLAGTTETTEETRAKKQELINKRILLEQAQNERWNEVLLRQHDDFPEYIQAVVLFAYVTCFSVVLPIAPLICLFNHLLSMRLDAYKLCRGRMRPLAHKTGGMGVWEHVLHIVTVIAVFTNCFLMGFTNSQFNWIAEKVGYLGLFCIVIGWEHTMLLLKYVINTSVSPFPKEVRDDMKKRDYQLERERMKARSSRRSKRTKAQAKDADDEATRTIRQVPSLTESHTDETLFTVFSNNSSEASSHVSYIRAAENTDCLTTLLTNPHHDVLKATTGTKMAQKGDSNCRGTYREERELRPSQASQAKAGGLRAAATTVRDTLVAQSSPSAQRQCVAVESPESRNEVETVEMQSTSESPHSIKKSNDTSTSGIDTGSSKVGILDNFLGSIDDGESALMESPSSMASHGLSLE